MHVFLKEYTAKMLNRGFEMTFHPITGNPLSQLTYHRRRAEFVWYRPVPRILWDPLKETKPMWQGRIGTGKARHCAGENYPPHWVYDPWTRQELKKDIHVACLAS